MSVWDGSVGVKRMPDSTGHARQWAICQAGGWRIFQPVLPALAPSSRQLNSLMQSVHMELSRLTLI